MSSEPIKAIVTDIEGTTSSIRFVHEVLFPYAREHLPAWVRAHAQEPAVRAELQAVAQNEGQPLDDEQAIAVLLRWIAEDRKATPLKTLQGWIWREGYESGALHGHVYPEVAACLRQWHAAGLELCVYSSGSVEAQQLIFGYSLAGDLRPLFSAYFDTRIGAKREVGAYAAIAGSLQRAPGEILFLSDIGAELDAARSAGFQTCQLLRDDSAVAAPQHPAVRDFTQLAARLLPAAQA